MSKLNIVFLAFVTIPLLKSGKGPGERMERVFLICNIAAACSSYVKEPNHYIMKRTIFVLSILIAGIMLSAQTIGTNNLYQKYKGEKGVISIYIPGFAIRLAGSIADLDREERKLLRSIKSVRILTIEDQERFKGVNFAREAKIKPGQGGFKMI